MLNRHGSFLALTYQIPQSAVLTTMGFLGEMVLYSITILPCRFRTEKNIDGLTWLTLLTWLGWSVGTKDPCCRSPSVQWLCLGRDAVKSMINHAAGHI